MTAPGTHRTLHRTTILVIAAYLLLSTGAGFVFLEGEHGTTSYPLDDAWIHEVYARHLAAGLGPSYNPPEWEAGFSSPLWLAVLTTVRLFTDSLLPIKLMGLLFLVLAAYSVRNMAGAVAGALVLIDPNLLFAAFSGMEVTLFAGLTALAMEWTLARRPGRAGVATALAILARPEGVLLLALLPLATEFGKDRVFSGLTRLIVPGILAIALWCGYCLAATGRPFPNTFYAKLTPLTEGTLLSDPVMAIGSLIDYFTASGWTILLAGGILGVAALRLRPSRSTRIAVAWCIALPIGVLLTRSLPRPEAFYWGRYLAPTWIGFYLLAGFGMTVLWRRGPLHRLVGILAGGILAATSILTIPERSALFEANCHDVARYQEAAGRWIADHGSPGDRVAVQDAGAIRIFSHLEVVDLAGLNNHHLTQPANFAPGADPSDLAALADATDADWLVLFARHCRGRFSFTLEEQIHYDDCSTYVIPEPFTLLILKRDPERR